MKILRLTRHQAEEAQLRELLRIFGEDAEVVEVTETVPHVGRIREIVTEHGADILEAVLPLPLLAQCLNPREGVGVPVIRAITIRTLDESGDNATFTFSHYERIVKVEVVTEKL